LSIDFIENNKIFIKNTIIRELQGNMVTLKIYSKQSPETLEEYNKNNITIVIPDSNFNKNYNYENILYKGCQLICMNFQTIDMYMKKYINYYDTSSIRDKMKILKNDIVIPKSLSLNSMIPRLETDIILDIDYNFLDNIGNKGTITCLRVIL
jgi:hypothetical protein